MNEQPIEALKSYDGPSLDQAFSEIHRLVDDGAERLSTKEAGEAFRLYWLGRKQGRLKLISDLWLSNAPVDRKGDVGKRFNVLKAKIEILLSGIVTTVEKLSADEKKRFFAEINRLFSLDISLPGTAQTPGIAHPLLKTMQEIVAVFHHLGYSTNLGPQVETDFYNFEALNFPPSHPARDTQDTLVIAGQQSRPARDRLLMRTHTSPVQIRTMIAQAPPVRIVIPGKVHRNDAADATHSPVFHQVEGLCVDTNITFSDLKGTLDHAMKALFGSDVKTRFFPSFFPFTEPSADVQISCIFCAGKGCRKCKHSGWIELLGCGMVDPAVFAAVDGQRVAQGRDPAYDPAKISGFAFGMGVERIAMIQHGIADIGQFYSGDMRFLEQFT